MFKNKLTTSWEPVNKWYKNIVGKEGHYYHQNVVIPGILKLLKLENSSSILDLACGNGVMCNHLPKNIYYEGVDLSASFIKEAKKNYPTRTFYTSDITEKLPVKKSDFTHAIMVLALQNLEHPHKAFHSAAQHIKANGKFIIVMNHPSFRIPRQSSWKVDSEQQIQYRRVDRYSSALKIPIQSAPSKGEKSPSTWSFHYPLADYSRWLNEAGFAIELIEEWHSDKVSTGKAAKMENRCRDEFPLFMTLICNKQDK